MSASVRMIFQRLRSMGLLLPRMLINSRKVNAANRKLRIILQNIELVLDQVSGGDS